MYINEIFKNEMDKFLSWYKFDWWEYCYGGQNNEVVLSLGKNL